MYVEYYFRLLELIDSSMASFALPVLPVSILDIIIVGVIIFYIYEGFRLGFVLSFADLLGFVLSFLIALKFYTLLGGFFHETLNVPQGFSNAISFFVIALVSEILLSILFRKAISYLRQVSRKREIGDPLVILNSYLGVIPGVVSAVIIMSFIFTVIISLPSSPVLKNAVTNSVIGSRMITHAASTETTINNIFGGALYETLSFMTVAPSSEDSINLDFKIKSPRLDKLSEEEMLIIVNSHRRSNNLNELVMDEDLRGLSRDYAKDMLSNGYFSHVDLNGYSPFDRMDLRGIEYLAAGENLAFAPNVKLAMHGLMESPGHRANILSENFNKIGIGVYDAGIYGKMFVQEFSD